MWELRWKEISARITAFKATTSLYFTALSGSTSDPYGVSEHILIPESMAIRDLVKGLHKDFKDVLPPSVSNESERILRFQQSGTNDLKLKVMAEVVVLASLQASLDFHLAGREAIGRSITERAFAHLQRSIVADDEYRKKWRNAFEDGETKCERLGATHLLLHGIWGFKINAEGARTDLVFGEPLELGQVERSAPAALVLTEWKKASMSENVDQAFDRARKQTKLYAGGALSDLELSSIRYVIVVTEKFMKVPDDHIEGNIRFRHKIVSVNPDNPSDAAKKPSVV
jgi:hypothetical protein